jgi:hypothetical protein
VTKRPHSLIVIYSPFAFIYARNDGAFMPHGIVFEFDRGSDGDSGKTMGWSTSS